MSPSYAGCTATARVRLCWPRDSGRCKRATKLFLPPERSRERARKGGLRGVGRRKLKEVSAATIRMRNLIEQLSSLPLQRRLRQSKDTHLIARVFGGLCLHVYMYTGNMKSLIYNGVPLGGPFLQEFSPLDGAMHRGRCRTRRSSYSRPSPSNPQKLLRKRGSLSERSHVRPNRNVPQKPCKLRMLQASC